MKNLEVHRAIISVSNKENLVPFARFLSSRGIEILSTGGTAKTLKIEEIPVKEVSDFTGMKEVMSGRLKTLHPKVFGGILARRTHEDLQSLDELGGAPIDLIVVNFYPFEETAKIKTATFEELIEKIDIGGPSMVRAAAKNFESVCVVVDPKDYLVLMDQIKKNGGIDYKTRLKLASKAFEVTARYDAAIALKLSHIVSEDKSDFPPFMPLFFKKVEDLRYGENPHQKAAFYKDEERYLGNLIKHQGKELSYNNIIDIDAAYGLVLDLPKPASAVIKHTNPCGVGLGETPLSAFLRAKETDPLSSFGGIVAFNVPVDKETASALTEMFLEVIVAPRFDDEALEILSKKKNLRVISITEQKFFAGLNYKRVAGGLLVQESDTFLDDRERKVVTKREPTKEEMEALELAYAVCKHVKSNAIVLCDRNGTVGVGAGQMSRVDSVKISKMKAFKETKGCVAASDAFFPFPDGIEELGNGGITAVIQPGGSIKDKEVIEAADRYNMAMVFTGRRHFRHG
ncbi:MAG: bifunctional phosphoribosylaminoimidazolecarboxamide formyltransferase/IMP cyclohydrolase [Thermoanaerobaculaceae bacterium]|nr:bifunctional phosphoribosylaminoimidazolecarboxamide formyltransferase/IMP cyclohydrolase [Thermoanaerobaculaceae bacterium]